MEVQERKDQLYNKTVGELVEMIIKYEVELEKTKEYRALLVRIKSMLTPPDERRRKGRPAKGEEII